MPSPEYNSSFIQENETEDESQKSWSEPIRSSSEASTSRTMPRTPQSRSDTSAPSRNKRIKTTKSDARVDEAYTFMWSIQDQVKPKDDFAVYGENVASRMRNANQTSRAVAIAKNRIDTILFQLEMGEFASQICYPSIPQSQPHPSHLSHSQTTEPSFPQSLNIAPENSHSHSTLLEGCREFLSL